MKRARFVLLALLMLVSVSAFSQTVPASMNFQGRLAKPDGTPVADNAAQPITFRLLSALTGGTALWAQTSNVAVRNGAFAVTLNFAAGFNGTNTLSTAFASSPYLEITIGANTALAPRQPFSSVAYAFNAGTANTVANGSIGLNQIADGVLNFTNIGGAITGSQIASGAVASANLTVSLQQTLGALSLSAAPFSYPVLQGSASTNGYQNSIAYSGGYVYVIGNNSLEIFDVSSPASPSLKSSIATNSNPTSIAVSGSYAYLIGNGLFQAFDVSNPIHPTFKTSLVTGSGNAAMVTAGLYAYYVVSATNTLQIADISNPFSIRNVGSSGTGSGPVSVAVSGNYAFVVNSGSSTLQLFKVSVPATPVLTATIGTGSSPQSVFVSGNYAYVTTGNGTLQVFDISDLASPVLKSATAVGSALHSVVVYGNYAYIVQGNSLAVFDVSNPASPINRGVVPSGLNSVSLAVSGNYAYVLGSNDFTLNVFALNALAVKSNLQVAGGGSFGGGLTVGGGGTFAGNVVANGVTLTSDACYKTNIATLNNALDDVLSLRGVSYDWDREKWPAKNFSDKRQIGFIAQEIETIFPELVSTDANGYKSVNYIGVVPVLVEAVKAMKQDNDTLKKEVDELKAQVNENAEIKKRLAELAAALKNMQDAQNRRYPLRPTR